MAMSGRIYTMQFNAVTMSAVQDALAVYAGTTKKFAVLAVSLMQTSGSTVVNAKISFKHLPATVTAGSAGSAGALKPWVTGDAAATVTGRVNDTTQATTSGTAITLFSGGWSTLNGFDWFPPVNNRPPVIDLSEAFVVSIDTALASLVVSGTITIEEI